MFGLSGDQLALFEVSDFFVPKDTTRLDALIDWTMRVFDSLPVNLKYKLTFSGGKDSHVLLGMYLHWHAITGKQLDVTVVFSDTKLEAPKLYGLVDAVERLCQSRQIPFTRVTPILVDSFWVKQVGFGYPVPNRLNRWCTGRLKIIPMDAIEGIAIAGSHLGESQKRDNRLNACGSSECGIDQIEDKVEAIAAWTNCDVWDWICLHGDELLYPGVSDALHNLYDIAGSSDNSLRMGCFMCPVVSQSRIVKQVEDGIIPPVSVAVRDLIEELRLAPRILSERKKKGGTENILGAILVDARIKFWQKLQPFIPELEEYDWINKPAEQLVGELLERRSYPPSYREEWIREQEPLARPWMPRRKQKKESKSSYEQLSLLGDRSTL